MNFTEYQTQAARTMAPGDDRCTRLVLALGLAGEAGEIADLLKKHEGHRHVLCRDALREELGDLLWYVAAVATTYGIDLDVVALLNVDKLHARYPDGFSEEASRNRK